jgi:hypothetical protein
LIKINHESIIFWLVHHSIAEILMLSDIDATSVYQQVTIYLHGLTVIEVLKHFCVDEMLACISRTMGDELNIYQPQQWFKTLRVKR